MLKALNDYLEELMADRHRRQGEQFAVLAIFLGPWVVGVFTILSGPARWLVP